MTYSFSYYRLNKKISIEKEHAEVSDMAKFKTSAAQKIEKFLNYVMAQDTGEYAHAPQVWLCCQSEHALFNGYSK